MWKTFFITPLAGAIAAVIGWLGAIVVKDSMGAAELATLRFGWPGLLIAGVALASLLVLVVASDLIEPLVMTASAAIGVGLLWEKRDLPFTTRNLDQAAGSYWFAVSMMGAIFLLLLVSLRSAREATPRRSR